MVMLILLDDGLKTENNQIPCVVSHICGVTPFLPVCVLLSLTGFCGWAGKEMGFLDI